MKLLITLIVCLVACLAEASVVNRAAFVPAPEPKPEVRVPSFLFIQDNKLDACLERHSREIQAVLDGN